MSRRSGWDIWCGVEDMGHRSSPRLCGSSLAGDDSLVLGTFFRVCCESAAVGWRFALPAAVGGGVRGRPCSPSALQHTMCCSLRAPVHLWVQSLQADADMGLTQSKKTCSAFYQHRMRWPRRFPVLRMCEACDADDPRDFDYGCSAVPFFMQNMRVKPKNPLPDLEASCEEGADCAAGCAEGCAEELPAGEQSWDQEPVQLCGAGNRVVSLPILVSLQLTFVRGVSESRVWHSPSPRHSLVARARPRRCFTHLSCVPWETVIQLGKWDVPGQREGPKQSQFV